MKKKRKFLLGGAALAAIVLVFTVVLLGRGRNVGSASANGSYETESLTRRDLVNSISATGTFESNQKTSVSSDLANYKIKTVNVEIGDRVKKGDVICEFDSEDIEENLENARKDLEAAKKQNGISERTAARSLSDAKTNRSNQYDMATDGVKNAKENWNDAVKERDNLKKKYEDAKAKVTQANDKLRVIQKTTNPEGYAAAQTSLAEAKANRDNLKMQYDTAVSTVKSAKTAYEKAVKDRKAADTTNASNVANMEDSLTSTKIGNESTLDGVQYQIDTYKKQLKKTVVRAEGDGVITILSVTEGQTYMGGDIAVIEDPEDLVVTAEIEEYEISDIREGVPVKIKTEATGKEELNGKVTYVASVATSASGSVDGAGMVSSGSSGVTYEVKVTLDQQNERIRLGMTAKMSIVTDEVKNVFAVPYDAIAEKESGEKFVYAIQKTSNGEESAKTEPAKTEIGIETGLESNYYVEITGSQLEEGMLIYVPIEDSGSPSMEDMRSMFEGQDQGNGGRNP